MTIKNEFTELVLLAVKRSALSKIVFSKPISKDLKKASGRLIIKRGRVIMTFEYSLEGNTVSQKHFAISDLKEEISRLTSMFSQANLITTQSDAEYKISRQGKEVILGGDKLRRKLESEEKTDIEAKIESLDRRKNYILSGKESFLFSLGISDKNGRVHDKKQGKFRQINRFLEHIEVIYPELSQSGELIIYDLCCGKSYLSFAVYHYLTEIKKRQVFLLGIDLKRDVIDFCSKTAHECGFAGMNFVYDDVKNTPKDKNPDIVISLHACDIATDIVINTAIELGAKVILSTPCCHRYLNGKVKSSVLDFITEYPHLSNKLCEAVTDSLRALKLRTAGYAVTVSELTDPENTPKNTIIRAIKRNFPTSALKARCEEYERALEFLLEDGKNEYLKEI